MAMRAREFFRTVRRAENELKILQAKVRHYEDLGLMITTSGSPGSGQRGASRVEMAAVGIVDATASLTDQIREYSAIISRAQTVIDRIPQDRYRQILTFKYLCGWSFRSISDELMYENPNSVYRAHGYALHEAQRVLDEMGE